MNIKRMFAQAFVRRIVYVLVGLLLTGIGFSGRAHAATTESQALAACKASYVANPQYDPAQKDPASPPPPMTAAAGCGWKEVTSPTSGQFYCRFMYQGSGPIACGVFGWDTPNPDCSVDAPPLSGGHYRSDNVSAYLTCVDGCAFEDPDDWSCAAIDGSFWCSVAGWEPTGQSCEAGPNDGVTPPTDSDGDGTSDPNDQAPENPGESDGEGEDPSTTCGGEGQPACEEGQGDGSGDGNTSGGGGSCASPPSSTGDAILAQIAFQTWATRCAVVEAANQANGGNGGNGGSGGSGGNGEQPEWTEGNAPEVPEDDTDYVDEQSEFGIGIAPSMLDTENIFGESSCPALPQFSFFGVQIDTGSFTWWCTLIQIMRAAILIMGAFTAIRILMGGI